MKSMIIPKYPSRANTVIPPIAIKFFIFDLSWIMRATIGIKTKCFFFSKRKVGSEARIKVHTSYSASQKTEETAKESIREKVQRTN